MNGPASRVALGDSLRGRGVRRALTGYRSGHSIAEPMVAIGMSHAGEDLRHYDRGGCRSGS